MSLPPSPAPVRHPSRDAILTAAVLAAVASAPRSQQFAELLGVGLPPLLDTREDAVFADIDGDGDQDLVMPTRRVLINRGGGIFVEESGRRTPAGIGPNIAVAAGDLDGDGDLDLVHGTFTGIDVLLNDGTGVFVAGTSALVQDAVVVKLGDVDGDGDLDAVVDANNRTTRLLLNDGLGGFTDATAGRIPGGATPTRDLALGDVDADGDLDIVVGTALTFASPAQNRLLLNDGTGVYSIAPPGHLSAAPDITEALALGDVDADGDLDLLVGNRTHNRLHLNDGTGHFTDVTGTQLPPIDEWTLSVAMGDIDGDGDLDILSGNRDQDRILLNDGSGTFATAAAPRLEDPALPTVAIRLADVQGDGDLDAVFMMGDYAGQHDRLLLNDGAGRFTDANAGRMQNRAAWSLATGDVDGDGDVDVFAGTLEQQNLLFVNDGTGAFRDATANLPSVSGQTRGAAMGDVDGDGDLDIVLAEYGEKNRLYLNDGTGSFTNNTAGRMPTLVEFSTCVDLGDIDGDGDLDMVFGNHGPYAYDRRQNDLYINDGTGRFTRRTAARLPAILDFTTSIRLGDLDGDGDLDLVAGNGSYGYFGTPDRNRILLNDGSGVFADVTATHFPPIRKPTTEVSLGDVDGDGDLDILFADSPSYYAPGRDRLFVNDGTARFTNIAARLNLSQWSTAASHLADLDGDGDLDILSGVSVSRTEVWINQGGLRFVREPTLFPPTSIAPSLGSAEIADIDGDGDLDVVALMEFGRTGLFVNLRRQLDTPHPLVSGRTFIVNAYAQDRAGTGPAVAFPFVAAARGSAPLPPFGTLGLDPASLVPLPAFPIRSPEGIGSLEFLLPDLAPFTGAQVHLQAIIVRGDQGLLTNVVSDTVLQ